MKTRLSPISVVTETNCITRSSSLNNVSTDFPIILKAKKKQRLAFCFRNKLEQHEKGKKKSNNMTEKYFKKWIVLHCFSHQFWLVFISISSSLVETWPIPPRGMPLSSFLSAPSYSHAHVKAAGNRLPERGNQPHLSSGLSNQAEELLACNSCLYLK